VVIPVVMRDHILDELHVSHPGIVRMKALARNHVWWPKIDADIEARSKKCSACQIHSNDAVKQPPSQWPYPAEPWDRIHIDYAGPFESKMHLVIVDAHSKWIEVESMTTATSSSTIEVLQRLFAQFGYPRVLVSDNGPQFASKEFRQFLEHCGTTHLTSSPYFPATNGAAERSVQTFKQAMRAEKRGGRTFKAALQDFLMQYRATPHTTTNESPAQLFLGRSIRTRLTQIRDVPVAESPTAKTLPDDAQADATLKTAKPLSYSNGDCVYVRVYGKLQRWTAGVVESRFGTKSFTIKLLNGTLVRRHLSQMKARADTQQPLPGPKQTPSSVALRRSRRTIQEPPRYGFEK